MARRWNEKGVSVVYFSSHLGLAALEKFVHAVPAGREIVLHAVAVEIATRHVGDAVRPDRLPPGWRDAEPGVSTMDWGSQWAQSRQSLVALIPSALLPLACFEHSWEFNLMPAADDAYLTSLASGQIGFALAEIGVHLLGSLGATALGVLTARWVLAIV